MTDGSIYQVTTERKIRQITSADIAAVRAGLIAEDLADGRPHFKCRQFVENLRGGYHYTNQRRDFRDGSE